MKNYEKIKRLYNLIGNKESFGYQKFELVALETTLKIDLPKKLRNYYLTLGKNQNINYSHNRLLKPNKEIGFSDDKYLIFYEENQAAAYWGIKEKDLKYDNPAIWGNYGSKENSDWHIETKTTENFLLLMAIYNGTLGGLKYHANSFELATLKTVEKIKNDWIELTEISCDKQKIYTDDFNEVISLSFDDKKQCTAIFIGTSHKDRFDNLLNLSVNWTYISYADDLDDTKN